MEIQVPGIVHHPFLVDVGRTTISGYGIALLAAFGIAWVTIARVSDCRGENPAFAGEIILSTAIGGLLGAKLYYAVFIGSGAILTRGGHAFWGGLIGGACAYFLWARLRAVDAFLFLDATAIGVAAGYSVGRTGCWAVGDDYGRIWNSPFAVRFPEGAPPTTAGNMLRIFGEIPPFGAGQDTVLAVHPTQLYEVVLGFGMFLVLWRLRNHRHASGWLFGVYCVLAGSERFFIEFVRVKTDRVVLALSVAQLVALAVAGIGGWLMYCRRAIVAGRADVHV